MITLRKVASGFSFSLPERTVGRLNLFNHIATPTSVGDATPIMGNARIDSWGRVGGLPQPISLPTDKVITNFPLVNNQNTKSFLSSVRQKFAQKKDALKPVVKLKDGTNQIAIAKDWRINPRAWNPIRGGITKTFPSLGQKGKAWDFRKGNIPQDHPLSVPINTAGARSPIPDSEAPISTISIDAVGSAGNPRLSALGNASSTTQVGMPNNTLFLIAAVIVAILVLRNAR